MPTGLVDSPARPAAPAVGRPHRDRRKQAAARRTARKARR